MADFDKVFTKLQKIGGNISYRRGTIPPKLVRTNLRPVYASLCAIYKDLSLDQRTDCYLFFETRDNLLEELIRFASDMAREASRLLKAGKTDMAQLCVEQAVAADLMVDGRSDPDLIEQAQQHIIKASAELNFDYLQHAKSLGLKAAAFSKAAVRLQAEDQRLEAIQALGIAMQMYPGLARHPQAVDLAVSLTGKPEIEAVALLQDRFDRSTFVDEQMRSRERKDRPKQRQAPESNFWLITIGGSIFIALVPPLTFPLVFGPSNDPRGVPQGLIIGVVTSSVYLMGQLKRRRESKR